MFWLALRMLRRAIDQVRLSRGGPETRAAGEIRNAIRHGERLSSKELSLLTEPEARCADANADVKEASQALKASRSTAHMMRLITAVDDWDKRCGPYQPAKKRQQMNDVKTKLERVLAKRERNSTSPG